MCTGTAPTIDNPTTFGLSHDTSSCNNTLDVLVSALCGSSGWTLELRRTINASTVTVYSVALPDGPFTASPYNYIDLPPCGDDHDIFYQWHITCAGVIQSSSDSKSTSQGNDPTLTNPNTWTLSHNNTTCQNSGTISAMVPCGVCAGWKIKIYASETNPPEEDGDHLIHTEMLPEGPDASVDAFFQHTPECGRTTWYYKGVLYDDGDVEQAETQVRSTAQGGAGSITFNNTVCNDVCLIQSEARASNPNCGECPGIMKLYRNVGVVPTFVPGEVVYSAATPAGPYVNDVHQYQETLGDGTYFYAWRLENADGGVDATSVPQSVNPECNPYVPATVTLPEGAEFQKQVVLVQVTGSPAGGWTYTDRKILHEQEQRLEWWYHKNGGCGAFRFLTHEFLDDYFDNALAQSWEIHVRMKLPGEDTYVTWFRGVIRSIRQQEQGAEMFTDVGGYGYVEMLDNIQVQRVYPAGMTVKQTVDHIVQNYIRPYTRILVPEDVDPTNGDDGVDASNYVFQSDIHFECSALKAIKFLAELQGNREFGVDADRYFYFRESASTVRKAFFVGHDLIDRVAGGKTFSEANQIKVAGKSFGARDFLQVRADVTDITQNGLYEVPHEVPWVTGDADASRWADNIIAKHKVTQDWSIFQWQNINLRVDAQHPIGKIKVYGADVSNDAISYDVAKIQYIEGGWKNPREVTEMGRSSIQSSIDQPPLRANFYVGQYPRDIVEELEIHLREQLEALKGRHKQFRYPNDVTNQNVPGRIPGELKHYSKDVTNLDVINSSSELQDITNPRGVIMAWVDGQWTKVSIRRTVTALPARGKFIGEIISLITDVTNGAFGELRWWDGNSWEQFGTGSGGGSGASLSDSNPTNIVTYEAASPGVGTTASRFDHRHAVSTAVALDVTYANAEGSSGAFSRADHKHKGIHTVRVQGQADIFGHLDVTARNGVKASQSGNVITLEGTGETAFDVPVDVTNANAEGVASTAARSDHKHKGIVTVHVKGEPDIHGHVDITTVEGLLAWQTGNTINFRLTQSAGNVALGDFILHSD